MSTIRTSPVDQNSWLDYLLIFLFLPVLYNKYPARSQEPVHRVTWVIVYMLKTPVEALSIYMVGEYVFHERPLNSFETLLFVGTVVAFWELIAHRLLHLNKYTLQLLKERRIRQRSEAFMKEHPDMGIVLLWISLLLIIAFLAFFVVYLGITILSPVNPRGY